MKTMNVFFLILLNFEEIILQELCIEKSFSEFDLNDSLVKAPIVQPTYVFSLVA